MALRFGTYTEIESPPGGDHVQIVRDAVEVGVAADALGYGTYCTVEHPWFEQFSISTSPIALFATLAQRTKNLRFRALCHTLPLHNPFVLAGELALLDILVDGRLDVGIGRGHAWLQEPANIVMEENVERYPECVDILLEAWTKDRFSFDGKYYTANDLSVVPKPLQKPHPPIWQVGTSAKWVPRAVENGWGVALGGPAPNIAFEEAIALYHQACEASGKPSNLAYIKAINLHEDHETAIEQGAVPLKNFIDFNVSPMDSLDRSPEARERMIDAGYAFYAADDFPNTRNLSYEQLLEHEIVYAGDPKHVAEQLIDLWDRFRFDEFCIICHYGGISKEQALKTQELFAKEVMPLMNEAVEKGARKSGTPAL